MPKRAVVLGGGGARGAYQIGVWKALRERGHEYDIVTGTSVGALNAALMAQGDYEAARDMWLSLTTDRVILSGRQGAGKPEPAGGNRQSSNRWVAFIGDMVRYAGADTSPLERVVRELVVEERIRESPVELGLVTVEYPAMKPLQLAKNEIPEGGLVDYLLASSAYYPVFRRRQIGDISYIDGAYSDNLPAELALRLGAEELIAVDLGSTGVIRPLRADVLVTYIASAWYLGPALAFSPETAARNMRLGYLDTLRAFRRVEGISYAFPIGETRGNAAALYPVLRRAYLNTGVGFLRNCKDIPQIKGAFRFREQRFLGNREIKQPPMTFGKAVTTAAETAGELLDLPPDRLYSFDEFNRLLLERSDFLNGRRSAIETSGLSQKQKQARGSLWEIYRRLVSAWDTGQAPESIWGRAALSPRSFIAANYLFLLNSRWKSGNGNSGNG